MFKLNSTQSIFLSVFAIVFLISCYSVPFTGRKQLRLLPESTLIEGSLSSYQQALSQGQVVRSGAEYQMVQNSGQRIKNSVENYLKNHAKYANLTNDFKWEFNLLNDNTVNAWCMPGGKVAFYQGIMPICQNETGTAVVMGHEISHAIAKHGNERTSQLMALYLGGIALDLAMLNKSDTMRQLINVAYGVGSQIGIQLPFSRKHESEADEMGLMFMAMAGYDPREAPKFWERMAAGGGARPPEFLSTHPSPETRVANLNKLMPKAMKLYEASKNKK